MNGQINEDWAAWKRRTLIGFVVLAMALGAVMPLLSKDSWSYATFRYFAVVALSVLSLFWCVADGGFSNLRAGRIIMTTIILVPYVGVPIYVFQRRGLKQGMVMMVRIIAFVFLMAAIFGVTWNAVMAMLSN